MNEPYVIRIDETPDRPRVGTAHQPMHATNKRLRLSLKFFGVNRRYVPRHAAPDDNTGGEQ